MVTFERSGGGCGLGVVCANLFYKYVMLSWWCMSSTNRRYHKADLCTCKLVLAKHSSLSMHTYISANPRLRVSASN